MSASNITANRRYFLLGSGALFATLPFALPSQAHAQGLTSILAKASDSALDKLAVPGAFYGDEDIRIKLPLIGDLGDLGGLGDLASRASGLFGRKKKIDLLGGLTRTINDAAGVAAGEAKPIFRESINELSITDAPGIIGKNDGATRYLEESSGTKLEGKLRPLVDNSMTEMGAYNQLDKLGEQSSLVAQAGLTSDRLGQSVTEQALKGIFSYIANEEAKFRANPLDKVDDILGGIFG
ncbi:MAG: DUF4197 domain-containing protein [Erythrobacter sp.]